MRSLRKLRSSRGTSQTKLPIQPNVAAEEQGSSLTSMRFELTENSEEGRSIIDALINFNIEQVGPNDYRMLNVFVRDSTGQIVGGMVGSTYWGWLSIAYFWIHHSWRGKGLGTAILRNAEEEAIRRGCYSAQVTTFSFQNPEFYKANGYESFATLEDFPFGHRQYFFRKRLEPTAARSQPWTPK